MPRDARSRPIITIGTLFFFMSASRFVSSNTQQRNHDHAIGTALQNHVQRLIKELALRLRIDHERQISGRAESCPGCRA